MRHVFSVLLISAILSVAGCGGGDSSPKPASQTTQPEKAYRAPLMAQDVSTPYFESGTYDVIVNNVFGKLEYRLVEGEPTDVASVDKNTGDLTLLNPGDVRIIVEDTSPDYQTSSDIFTVHVEKGTNFGLFATTKSISTLEQKAQFLSVHGNKGTLAFEVAPESAHLIDIDSQTGEITPLGIAGQATIIVTDSGNRRYKPASFDAYVIVKAVNPEELDYADLSVAFSDGLTLTPQQLGGGDAGTYRFALAEYNEDSDVLTVDEATGRMYVHKVGSVMIKVTNELDPSYTQQSRYDYFKVEVKQADRPALVVSNASFVYEPNRIIEPAVNNVKGSVTYSVESGDDVVAIDSNTRLPKITGVGSATLVAYDDGNGNYLPSTARFEYSVAKAPHPGLSDLSITHTFTTNEQLRKLTPQMKGQKGSLTFSGSTDVVSIQPGSLVTEHAGTALLTAEDDGGDYYLPQTAKLTVNIQKAPHPAFLVEEIAQTYSSNLCVKPIISGNNGPLVISLREDEDTSVASYDAGNGCFKIHKHGSVVFDVVSSESADYLASVSQELPVIITAADSTIKVEAGIKAVFAKGQPLLAPPEVVGKKGTLSYRLAPSTKVMDVVQVNSQSGQMTVLNAGSTMVEVTDSGGDGYQPATTTFSVNITKAENPIAVAYPEVPFQYGKAVMPSVSDAQGDISYSLHNSAYDVAKLLDASTGKLEVHSAGNYRVSVIAKSTRNYLGRQVVVDGQVLQAPHPGIVTEAESFSFVPLKPVTLQLPAALGERSFSVDTTSENDKIAFASIDPNNGQLSMLNYDPRGGEVWLDVDITEAESNNYLALPASPAPEKRVIIQQPEAGQSDKDFTLAPLFSIFSSGTNNNNKYLNLQGTTVHFAGVYGVVQPTQDDLESWGDGMTLLLQVKPKGSDDPLQRKGIRVYVQRYVGCAYEVNEKDLAQVTPSQWSSTNYCYGSNTNRIVTFRVIDGEALGEGEWELLTPFVMYQKSETPFSTSDGGGAHVAKGSFHPGGSEPTQLIEWNLIDLKLSN